MSLKEKEKGILAWINDVVLPLLAKEGKLTEDGASAQIIKYDYGNSPTKGVDFFTSNIYFATISVEDLKGKLQEVDVIIKSSSQHDEFRALMETDAQFYNEVKMYGYILPKYHGFLSKKNMSSTITSIFPRPFFAYYDDLHPEKCTIILENLKKFGFRPAESKTDLDYAHCSLAMKALAEFHAVSFALKHQVPGEYQKVAKSWKEVRYQVIERKRKDYNLIYKTSSHRVIDLAIAKSKIPTPFLEKLKKSLEDPYSCFQKLVQPREPMSLICHGDFCRNNLLFKYDKNGQPIALKIIDFQTYRCASPAIDLTFFMYMNTTPELRELHFNDLLQLYYTVFVETVSKISQKESCIPEIFSFEDLLQEFGDHACYGFMIAAFFLPIMMSPNETLSSGGYEEEFVRARTSEGEERYLPRPPDPVIDGRLESILDDIYKYNSIGLVSER